MVHRSAGTAIRYHPILWPASPMQLEIVVSAKSEALRTIRRLGGVGVLDLPRCALDIHMNRSTILTLTKTGGPSARLFLVTCARKFVI